jgi:hypothetical protein
VVFVRLKLAGVRTPETEAVTMYEPAVLLAMNAAGVAKPVESVFAVVVVAAVSAKVPLAPLVGAANVTVAPLVADPLVVTVAAKGSPNAAPTAWLCGVPLAAAIVSTVPSFVERVFLGILVVQFTSARQITASAVEPAVRLMVVLDNPLLDSQACRFFIIASTRTLCMNPLNPTAPR